MKLFKLSQKKSLNVLGIMSGTSMDGVDYVLVQINRQKKIKFINQFDFKFPSQLKAQLQKIASNQASSWEMSETHFELGRFYAECFKKIPESVRKKIDLIGIHGQTVYHAPPRATMQLGEMTYLAAAADRPVISNFRVNDMTVGGQGAPLASLFHGLAFSDFSKNIAVQNLGGIGNVTHIINAKVVQCFDTGPANILMNLVIQQFTHGKIEYDDDGRRASQGQVDEVLLAKLMKEKFLNQKPPKSCGREEFGENILKKFSKEFSKLHINDLLATLCELSALSMAESYTKYLKPYPKMMIVSGGGSQNSFLLLRLKKLMPKLKILTSEDLGWPTQSIEGAAFACLAAYRLWEWPANIPKTTGAKKSVLLGQITQL